MTNFLIKYAVEILSFMFSHPNYPLNYTYLKNL